MSAAPDALAPPPGHPRFPHLDGLRALAALAVVAVHDSGFAGITAQHAAGAYTARLDVGVTVFFVLSGFLLYRPFVADALAGRPPVRLRDYARRRVLRIVPAYWLALTALAIWPGLPGVFTHDWWRYYGFAQIYWERTVIGGIAPAWTLCIEVTFYAALPLIALALRCARPALQLGALAAASLAALGFRTWLHSRGGVQLAVSTLPGMFDWFAGGMALAVVSVAVSERGERPRAVRFVERAPWACWALAVVLFWVVATRLGAPRDYDARHYTGAGYLAEHVLYLAIGVLLVAPAVFGTGARGPRRLLATPVVAWLGLISYGIYLWHVPLMGWLRDQGVDGWLSLGAAGLAFTLACAAASYYAVERPLLTLKDRRRPRRP